MSFYVHTQKVPLFQIDFERDKEVHWCFGDLNTMNLLEFFTNILFIKYVNNRGTSIVGEVRHV